MLILLWEPNFTPLVLEESRPLEGTSELDIRMASIHTTDSQTIAEEESDDDDSSSVYGKTIKRIIQRAQSIPSHRHSSMPPPSFFNSARSQAHGRSLRIPSIEGPHDCSSEVINLERQSIDTNDPRYLMVENRSLYSMNQYPQSLGNYHIELASQCGTSYMGDDNIELSSITENHTFDLFSAPKSSGLLHSNRVHAPVYQKRFHSHSVDGNIGAGFPHMNRHDLDSEHNDDLDSNSSDDSQPDMNTIWSWKNLKREFKLTQSEKLFHLYQAKLQHSFFVALLILNIIFYTGAIISHLVSKHIVDNCE